MRRAGLDFAISSWWGKGSYEDQVLQKILNHIMPRPDNPFPQLKWSILYELEKSANPSADDITRDLSYLKATFGESRSIMRIHDKIVLFVSGSADDQVEYTERWSEAASQVNGFYLVLKVFPGYSSVARMVDGWYQFAPTNRFECDPYFWGYVSPGFSKYDEKTPRLSRDPNDFAMALQRLRESNAYFALIETWNDWNEGTQIEPGTDLVAGQRYGDLYLDLVRKVMKEGLDVMPQQPTEQLGILDMIVIVLLVIAPTTISLAAKRGIRKRTSADLNLRYTQADDGLHVLSRERFLE
jgi:hypothetical protein